MIDPDQRRHVVPHRPHGVVALVAVYGPVAGFVGQEFDLAHLANGQIHRHLGPARTLGHRAAIGAGDFELDPVHVDGVVGHGQVAHAHAHPVAQARHQRVDAGEDAAVPGPGVEIEHGGDGGRLGTGFDVEGVEQEAVVAIDRIDQGVPAARIELGVRDPKTHHAHGELHHLVGVRVVHKGARAARLEFIDEGFAGPDRGLVDSRHPVHARRQALAVPVDGGGLGQAVADENAHPVALYHFDGGARALAVVAPHVDDETGRHLAHHRLGHEVKFLHPVAHPKGQRPAVERNHGPIRQTGPGDAGRHPGRGGGGVVPQHRLGQGGQGVATDGGGGGGRESPGSQGALEKLAALHGYFPFAASGVAAAAGALPL